MSTELSIYDKFEHPAQLAEFGKAICLSEMFGASNASQGMVLAMECAARRLPPMMLAERYHIIHGKLSMKADAILADFRTKFGGAHKILKRDADEARISLSIDNHRQTFSLTWAEAQQEPFVYDGKETNVAAALAKGEADKLTVKAKYRTPRSRTQMMWARVVSDGVRAMAPEVMAGYYTPEEISDFDGHDDPVDSPTDVVDVEAVATSADDTQPVNSERQAPSPAGAGEPGTGDTPDATKDASAEPVSSSRGKPGVRLDGQSDPYHVGPDDPCGEEVAREIVGLAKSLGMPPEKLKAVMADEGVDKLAKLPVRRAEKVLAKLKGRAADDDIPF